MFIKQVSIPIFPLYQEINKSYLSWIVGFLTILAVLTVSGFLALSKHLQFSSSQQMLTVMIPSLETSEQSATAVKKVLTVLENFPDFKEAKVIAKEQLISLLDPSLGGADSIKTLDFPTLIDVTFDNLTAVDAKTLLHKLRQFVAGIQVESHTDWQNHLNTTDKTIRTLGWTIISFIFIVILAIISLVTKFTLMAYQPIVDNLRLMGAKNSFIASHFQKQAFKSTFLGSGIGTVIICSLISLSNFFELPIAFPAFFTIKSLLYLFLFPIAIGLMSIAIARLIVIYTLYLLEK